jgi:hypothetical protein
MPKMAPISGSSYAAFSIRSYPPIIAAEAKRSNDPGGAAAAESARNRAPKQSYRQLPLALFVIVRDRIIHFAPPESPGHDRLGLGLELRLLGLRCR